MAEPNAVGGPKRRSILDGIMLGLFGTPTDEMTAAEAAKTERARAAARQGVAASAESAWKNPGAEHMSPPPIGQSDLLSLIGSISKMFRSGSGGTL